MLMTAMPHPDRTHLLTCPFLKSDKGTMELCTWGVVLDKAIVSILFEVHNPFFISIFDQHKDVDKESLL